MCKRSVPPYEQMSDNMKNLHDRLWEKLRFQQNEDRVSIMRSVLEEVLEVYEPESHGDPIVYDKDFGDAKICICGHAYVRHFDSYEDMRAVGCKYCLCENFTESGTHGA